LTYLQAIVLGTVQGLTEFLPVSSSGHLALTQQWLGLNAPPLTMEILLHLGTLLSVALCYRKELQTILRSGLRWLLHREPLYRTEGGRTLVLLVIACLPMAAAPFLKPIVSAAAETPRAIAFGFLGTFCVLSAARWAQRSDASRKTAASACWQDALAVGCCQLLALFPGVSRSGTVTTAGLVCGFSGDFARSFGFLLSVPVILAAGADTARELTRQTLEALPAGSCLAGMAAAALSGIAAIGLFRRMKEKFTGFRWYCLALGAAILLL